MEQSLSNTQNTQNKDTVDRQRDSTFGVHSLADTLEAAFGSDQSSAGDQNAELINGATNSEKDSSRSSVQSSPKASGKHSGSSTSSPIRRHKRRSSNMALSAAPTPLNIDLHTPLPPSAIPSTPNSVSLQSLKLSDEDSGLDEVTSQAITSSGEEEDGEISQLDGMGSFPQLVMPSIQMPKRRPFTTKGKSMGNIKILVAGESGVGKSSLIRSIVQLCEDIVHVDPLSPSQSFSHPPPPSSQARKRKLDNIGTTRITEIHASTKSYPHWWTEVEETRALRRRKSTSDAVLERNICFIDTPGFGKGTTNAEDINLVIDYVESLMYQNASLPSMEDTDLLAVIGGHGGLQVDLVLYLLPPSQDISDNVQVMQRLSALTNVVPIIAKSDTISQSEAVAIKTSILARLQNTSIRPFFFGKSLDEALLDVQGLSVTALSQSSSPTGVSSMEGSRFPFVVPTYPYTISSTSGPDTENMDASLLMSPDYVQPLLPSELSILVNQIFDPESIAWLRHAAAKKFLNWRRRTQLPGDSFALHGLQQQRLQRSSISGSSVGLHGVAHNASATSSVFTPVSPSGVLVPRATSPFYPSNLQSPFPPSSSPSLSHTHPEGEGPTDFSLARYNNYAQGEQRLAEVRLAKWAADLQRSLRNERERFEELQRAERARWLLERVGEEVKDGNIVTNAGTNSRSDWTVARRGNVKALDGAARYGRLGSLDARDPLGLCDFSDELRKRGLILVKVLGGVSVLGAVVVAVVRACGLENQLPEGGLWSWLTGAG